MKYYLLTLFTLSAFALWAQNGPAIIQDADGYTNVRSGPGMDFEVIDTLFSKDFFYYRFEESKDWAKVEIVNGRQTDGFVHKSRIQEVRNLDSPSLKELLGDVLDRQKAIEESLRITRKSNDSKAYRTIREKLEHHSMWKYNPALHVLPHYFCSTNDTEIIDMLFATMFANKGSANEMPSFSLGECFICNPDLVLARLHRISNSPQKDLILNQIEWGLKNQFEVDNDGKYDDPKYNELINRVNEARKQIN